MQTIKVRHNMEMAHRLFETPGKCQQIHGHSWWVELEIAGKVDPHGMILEFGEVKKTFRAHLDTTFDHHLLLNQNDILMRDQLPGVRAFSADPTTENIASAIADWARTEFSRKFTYRITVWETAVNGATAER